MASILFISTREKGHVFPLLGPAQWLVRLGHRVGWLCLPSCPDWLETMGIEPVGMDIAAAESAEEFVTEGPELAALVRDNDKLFHWIRRLLVDDVPALVGPTRAALRGFGCDALVVDPMIYQGVIAAHAEGIPYVCPSSSLNPVTPDSLDVPHNRNMRALEGDRKALFARFGMAPEFRVADCLSPFANTVFTTREYVGDIVVPPRTFLVGPSLPPDGRPLLEGAPKLPGGPGPLVYVSFGSQIYHQPGIFRLVSEATAGLHARVMLVCGPLAESEFAKGLPAHVTPVGFANQLEALASASVVVTHGGANTVMESLYFGVPILMSPVCNDQPMQAHFLEKRGAGIVLDLYRASAGETRNAIITLLDKASPQRRAAAEVHDSYAKQDGARSVAEIVLHEIGRGN